MSGNLAPYCIYTIVHVDELRRVHAAGGVGSFTENKKWVGGARLFREAVAANQRLPIVFADAASIDGLIYYALLTDISVMGDSVRGPTRYSFEGLTPIRPPVPKSTLIKMVGAQPLDDNYIRPYVLCHTPAFLRSGSRPAPIHQPFSQKATVQKATAQKVTAQKAGGESRPAKKKGKPAIYLFGYSGKTLEQIARALGNDGLLIDIRYSPRSRKAGFSRSGLERVFGDRYHHVREFGNVAYQSGGIQLADPEAGLRAVEALAAEQPGSLFLMCACEDGAFCHRREVGKLLQKRGYIVAEYRFDQG